jgi:hypothetical protein
VAFNCSPDAVVPGRSDVDARHQVFDYAETFVSLTVLVLALSLKKVRRC